MVSNGCIDTKYEFTSDVNDEDEDDDNAQATVLKYLTNQNRPYSVNDLVANLRNEIPKTKMQKVLDRLVQEDKVKENVNGKQKLYVVKQHNDDDDDAQAAVLKYLTDQNRPYSVNDLVANLRNKIPKTKMQKVLNRLVQEDKVKEKVNGKQKAYVVNQDDFPVASQAELDTCDKEATKVQELKTQFKEVEIENENLRKSNFELDAKSKEYDYTG